ncbi:hypothetical protein ABW21_db0200847 [Orbilia brochopaga]|nr:hypothetical protein ABW21_db0200847 [Drechslerella brochopaga]
MPNDTQPNGQTNGQTNGQANGHTNGHTNGQTNGQANGHTNGQTNGRSNDHGSLHMCFGLDSRLEGTDPALKCYCDGPSIQTLSNPATDLRATLLRMEFTELYHKYYSVERVRDFLDNKCSVAERHEILQTTRANEDSARAATLTDEEKEVARCIATAASRGASALSRNCVRVWQQGRRGHYARAVATERPNAEQNYAVETVFAADNRLPETDPDFFLQTAIHVVLIHKAWKEHRDIVDFLDLEPADEGNLVYRYPEIKPHLNTVTLQRLIDLRRNLDLLDLCIGARHNPRKCEAVGYRWCGGYLHCDNTHAPGNRLVTGIFTNLEIWAKHRELGVVDPNGNDYSNSCSYLKSCNPGFWKDLGRERNRTAGHKLLTELIRNRIRKRLAPVLDPINKTPPAANHTAVLRDLRETKQMVETFTKIDTAGSLSVCADDMFMRWRQSYY